MLKEPKKDKMIRENEASTKGTEFFFSGGAEYLPQTIIAESQREAEKMWLQSRKKVEQQAKE